MFAIIVLNVCSGKVVLINKSITFVTAKVIVALKELPFRVMIAVKVAINWVAIMV